MQSKLADLVKEVEDVISSLNIAVASPTPISTWDYKKLIMEGVKARSA